MTNCVKCGASMRLFGKNQPSDELANERLRSQGYDIEYGMCRACAEVVYGQIKAGEMAPDEAKVAEEYKQDAVPSVNVYTICPQYVDFAYIGIVSSHVALGTGLISHALSSLTDFFGQESSTYSDKLQAAEGACLAKLKIRAHEMGADMVIGMQTTYTELTSGHGMLLVCMAGTAVKQKQ
ncbi:YbjQ family protein [Desulfovibrio sp. OttesenSCG-928-A18]|nr:YbjQ family protein [Desulfovibrio sp. OttesenSCG-928-A18]